MSVWGLLAWLTPCWAPAGGQVNVGQGARVGGGGEDGVECAALGAPGHGNVVSGGFAQAVQLVGGRGPGGLDECIGQP